MIDLRQHSPRPLTLFGLNDKCTFPTRPISFLINLQLRLMSIFCHETRKNSLIVRHKTDTSNTCDTDFPPNFFPVIRNFGWQRFRWISFGGALTKVPKTFYPVILMKLGDLVGMAFIRMNPIFMSKFYSKPCSFQDLLMNWGSWLVTGLVTGLETDWEGLFWVQIHLVIAS